MLWLRSTIFNICFYAVTAVCCFLYLPTLLLPRSLFLKFLSYYFHLLHWLEKTILHLDCRVVGADNIPKEGSFIVAAKHQSTYETMKIPLLFSDFSVILKRELMWIPLWGWFAAKARMIPVNRGSREKAIQSIIKGARKMKDQGRPIVIFPQGTRVKVDHTPLEKPYKQGVVHMAKAVDLPIVPLSLNSGVFWPRKAWMKKPGTVIFEFGEPIYPVGEKREILAKLENQLETRSNELAQRAMTDPKNDERRSLMSDSISSQTSRIHKSLFGFFILLLLTGCFAYTSYWFWYAHKVSDTIKTHTQELAAQGILLEKSPKVSGFPMLHRVIYEGNVTTPLATFDVPYLKIQGITFPYQSVRISFPEGFEWRENFQGQNSYKLDQVWIKLSLPESFPEDTSHRSIQAWRNQSPSVVLEEFLIRKDPMVLKAQAQFGLSTNLQPEGEIVITSRGHAELVQTLTSKGELSPQDHIFMQSALKSFSREDEKTGEQILHLAFEIRNNALFLGPLRIMEVPIIQWQKRPDT